MEHVVSTADVLRLIMKKFLQGKKAAPEPLATHPDSLSALTAPSPEISPGLKKSGTSRWKRGKKPVEQKPELDIAAALPSSDDFRTSLLMPNLSARFSMLREQDDPNSLIGKASDDSVLQPRRRSRMMDFSFNANALNDIAEVQSIHSSIKKPWAVERHGSFGSEDGYNSENESSINGSVMSRARPGEGNTMFGGRQKVYKIAGSGVNSTRSLGKAVYEDDMGLSAFQKFRQRREELQRSRPSEDSQGFDFGLDHNELGEEDGGGGDDLFHDSAKDLTHSPSLSSYDKKRSTTSSTARSEARSSTAATSVASQSINGAQSPLTASSQAPAPASAPGSTQAGSALKRSDTKGKRLYEPALDQHIHDQQNHAMNRLNSIHRQRTIVGGKQSPPVLHSTKSVGSFHDRPAQPVYALNTSSSPPPVSPLPAMKSLGSLRMQNSSPMASGPHSPVSPQEVEETDVLIQALEPGDRGKATAMGAFNKPKQSFDEQRYLERQQQLQRSQSRAGLAKAAEAAAPAIQNRIDRFEHNRDAAHNASGASTRSRSRSTTRENLSTQQPSIGAATQHFDKSRLPDTHRTFFGNISASESEEDEDDDDDESANKHTGPSFGTFNGRWPNTLPPVSEHPAMRRQKSKASLAEEDEDLEPGPLRTNASSHSLRNEAIYTKPQDTAMDSPTLGPNSRQLNGMVQHLRQKSNQSSIYPEDQMGNDDELPEMPEWAPKNLDLIHRPVRGNFESDVQNGGPRRAISNPWDPSESDLRHNASDNRTDSVRTDTTTSAHGPSKTTGPVDRLSEVSQIDSENAGVTPWENELHKHHARETSTATQQERDAFANELAARRTAIQENMKSMVERDTHSRGQSPGAAFRSLGMLKSRSSKESVRTDARRDVSASSKARKMFSAGGNANASSSSLGIHPAERSGFSNETSRPRGDSGSQPASVNGEPVRPSVDSGLSKPDLPNGRSPAVPHGGFRSRSNSSATTGRSRSRTGPYRDDLEKAMIEGTSSRAYGLPDALPISSRELTPRPSPDVIQQSHFEQTVRDRSGSRSAMSNYFDAKVSQSAPSTSNARSPLVTGGSAAVTFPPNSFAPTGSARPSPIVASSPFPSMTPPLSGPNTPSTFSAPPQVAQYRPAGVLRKKTISKSDISEPFLISSTSNVDTVDLPEGASLQNGMDEAPPLPPINPRRRTAKMIFSRERSKSGGEDARGSSRSTPTERDFPLPTRKPSSNDSYPCNPAKQSLDHHSNPSLNPSFSITPRGSPERVQHSSNPAAFEGGMF
nr:hypothetical protein CFP56_62867 [Quercus suber]